MTARIQRAPMARVVRRYASRRSIPAMNTERRRRTLSTNRHASWQIRLVGSVTRTRSHVPGGGRRRRQQAASGDALRPHAPCPAVDSLGTATRAARRLTVLPIIGTSQSCWASQPKAIGRSALGSSHNARSRFLVTHSPSTAYTTAGPATGALLGILGLWLTR